jgi:hypothetical protein
MNNTVNNLKRKLLQVNSPSDLNCKTNSSLSSSPTDINSQTTCSPETNINSQVSSSSKFQSEIDVPINRIKRLKISDSPVESNKSNSESDLNSVNENLVDQSQNNLIDSASLPLFKSKIIKISLDRLDAAKNGLLSKEEYNKCKDFLTDNDSSNYTLAVNKLKYKYYLTSTTYHAKSYERLNEKESTYSDLAEKAEGVNDKKAAAFSDSVAAVFRAKAEQYYHKKNI